MKVFITGGTGYMGSRLIPLLVERGHEVKAVVRKGSETKLPAGTTPVPADPLRMDSYTEQVRGVRSEGERMIRESGMPATFVRPWYVLGPGHRWAYMLLPFYWVCERLPATRESARRLGLVTTAQMLDALVWALENPADDLRILDVPKIRDLAGG